MDDAHLMVAVRYVELNPVAARMVAAPEDWPWSSARSHLAGRRVAGDRLTDVTALGVHVSNWRALLKYGVGAGGVDAAGAEALAAIETRLRTGRPLGPEQWIARHEQAMDRKLAPQRRGPKAKARGN